MEDPDVWEVRGGGRHQTSGTVSASSKGGWDEVTTGRNQTSGNGSETHGVGVKPWAAAAFPDVWDALSFVSKKARRPPGKPGWAAGPRRLGDPVGVKVVAARTTFIRPDPRLSFLG